jgi:hypothetical protein
MANREALCTLLVIDNSIGGGFVRIRHHLSSRACEGIRRFDELLEVNGHFTGATIRFFLGRSVCMSSQRYRASFVRTFINVTPLYIISYNIFVVCW